VKDDPLENFGRKLIQNWNRRRNLVPVRYCLSVWCLSWIMVRLPLVNHVEDDPPNFGRKLSQDWNCRRNLVPVRYCLSVWCVVVDYGPSATTSKPRLEDPKRDPQILVR
jgi:hypothetical protein